MISKNFVPLCLQPLCLVKPFFLFFMADFQEKITKNGSQA